MSSLSSLKNKNSLSRRIEEEVHVSLLRKLDNHGSFLPAVETILRNRKNPFYEEVIKAIKSALNAHNEINREQVYFVIPENNLKKLKEEGIAVSEHLFSQRVENHQIPCLCKLIKMEIKEKMKMGKEEIFAFLSKKGCQPASPPCLTGFILEYKEKIPDYKRIVSFCSENGCQRNGVLGIFYIKKKEKFSLEFFSDNMVGKFYLLVKLVR